MTDFESASRKGKYEEYDKYHDLYKISKKYFNVFVSLSSYQTTLAERKDMWLLLPFQKSSTKEDTKMWSWPTI